jgi:protein-S-isoprenylcysteine O-methyltransferase Ste14
VYLQALRSAILGTLTLLAITFLPAGTLHYWQGWVYVAVFVITSAVFTIYLAIYDPALLQRRMQVGPSHERETVQKIVMVFAMLAFLSLIVLPALDYRFGWSVVPAYISILGDGLVALGFYFFYLVVRVNSYAASNIRVEQDQKVVSTGPYAIVRHPMYSGALVLLIGTPLALGSWWTLLLVPLFLPILIVRILNEEKVLARRLLGYTEYQQKVRFRLIPAVW